MGNIGSDERPVCDSKAKCIFASMIQQIIPGQVKLSPTDPCSGKTILTCHGLINDGCIPFHSLSSRLLVLCALASFPSLLCFA